MNVDYHFEDYYILILEYLVFNLLSYSSYTYEIQFHKYIL